MFDTSGRLFCFGCSLTRYDWPTWADLAGTNWKKFENWGEPGAGNQFIFNSVIECDVINKFTSNDTVAIMWTAPARHDFFSVNKWGHVGHSFNEDNELLPCPDGYWLTSLAYIYAIDQLLKNRQIPYVMTSWVDYTKLDSKFHSMFGDLLATIKYVSLSFNAHKIKKNANVDQLMETLYDALSGPDWPSLESIKNNQYTTSLEIKKEIEYFWHCVEKDNRVKMSSIDQIDTHPLPSEHLQIAKKIFSQVPWNNELEQWAKDLDSNLLNGRPACFDKHLPNKNYYHNGELCNV